MRRQPTLRRRHSSSSTMWSALAPRLIAFFFFQAEDGIRDHCVTGVQTCALPIYGMGSVSDLARGYSEAIRPSKLHPSNQPPAGPPPARTGADLFDTARLIQIAGHEGQVNGQIGRASCRERVKISAAAVAEQTRET